MEAEEKKKRHRQGRGLVEREGTHDAVDLSANDRAGASG